jgi:catalase
VLHDAHLVRKMQHFNRERIPERVVHAKGSGAHGFFEVTEDVTQWTSASFLSEVRQAHAHVRALLSGRGRARQR